MTVVHHIDDATLVRFASGETDQAVSVAVAAHIDMCPTCREALRKAEACGGQLLESSNEASLAADAYDKLRAQLENEPEVETTTGDSASAPESDVPRPLQHFIGPSLDAVKWKSVAPGVKKHEILADRNSSSLYMLHISAGSKMPEHGHHGQEMTLVLSGAYRDKMGRFARGDIADLDEDTEHQPIVEPGAPCICLVAAESRIKPKGLLVRLLQPLVRI